ncbi:MAG: hypothetical protein N3D84_02350 [Candidatus Woesearchaeota archaeon]|nr:hypothetical protein [Candidatus Woesearchaeota archaeon]
MKKNFIKMGKKGIVIVLFVILVGMSANENMPQILLIERPELKISKNASWNEAKKIYEEAFKNNVRAKSEDGWSSYERWLKEKESNIDDKINITKLWILNEYGSYTDLVLVGIKYYAGLYQSKIFSSDNVDKDFKEYIKQLLEIYSTLDYQIHTRYKYEKEIAPFKEHFFKNIDCPISERYECLDYKEEMFIKKYPPPGFISSFIYDKIMEGERTFENYHRHEREYLQEVLLVLQNKKANLNDYMYFLFKSKEKGFAFGDPLYTTP